LEDKKMSSAGISNLCGKITVLVVFLGMVGLCVNTALALSGSGTQEEPWRIQSLADFDEFAADANYWDDYTRLETDVNLAGRIYTTAVIAPDINDAEAWFHGTAFTGVFDGHNHTIYNFTYDSNDKRCIGLFGYVDGHNAEIKDLGLIAPDVNDGMGLFVGSMVGCLRDGTINGCYVEAGNVSGGWEVGGLVGMNEGGTITNCYSVGSVKGGNYVGGLMGENHAGLNPGTITGCYSAGLVTGSFLTGGLIGLTTGEGAISNCFSSADVYGDSGTGGLIGLRNIFPQYLGQSSLSNCYVTGNVYGYEIVGGLVGHNIGDLPISYCYAAGIIQGTCSVGGLVGNNGSTITNSYATGNVIGNDRIGGLVGWNVDGAITHSYAVGSVVGDANVGGLVGQNGFSTGSDCYVGVITNSYWDIETSGEPNMCGYQVDCSAGCNDSYGKTTAEMKQQCTFDNWDFINVWNIGENQTYPYLRTYLAGDINKDGIVNFRDLAFMALQWLEEFNSGNQPPEVEITYPEDGERLIVGGIPPQTMILAEANDHDGTVVRVEFFDDGLKLGEDTDGSDGWNYLWQDYSLGWHVLTATAWDNEGLSGTSPPVNVEVWMPDPPPP
jgi:hypothetical protein